ncbi:hypothetical protein ACJMK2_042691, partial [Sinanodonta woodiana]
MSVTEYNRLSNSDESWFCSKCFMPFTFSDPFFENIVEDNTTHSNARDKAEYSNNSLNNVQIHIIKCFESKGLHFICLNVRSLLPKISELQMIA